MRFFIFSINPSHFHTVSSLFQFISIQILSCLQPSFPKWFESVLRNLDHFPWISTIRGGTLCGRKKNNFSVHNVIRNRSIWRPCQFLILSPNTMWKTSLSIISRPLLIFPHPTILLSWIRFEKGDLPFLWWNPVSPPYSMYARLQPNFPKWIESALAQPRPFPMDLHHSLGGPFAVEKKQLFSTQSNKKSVILETLPDFDFVTKHPVKNIPIYYFPTSFDFSSSYYLAFLNTIRKGGPPFPLMKPCITAIFYVSAFAT